MKNKYTILVMTSLIVTVVALSPLVSFAKEKGGSGEEKENNGRSNPPKAIGIGNGGQKDLPPGIAKKLVKLEDQNNEAENRGAQNINKNDSNSNEVNSNKDNSNIFRLFREWFNSRYGDRFNDGHVNMASSSATSTLPTISNFVATSTRQRIATVSWVTNEKATSLVWYATTSPVNTLVTPNISRSGLIEKHRLNINRLLPGTKYFVVVGSRDRDGNLVVSSETSFTTSINIVVTPGVVTDTTAPTISGVNALVSSSTATVNWTTNENATSKVFYSTSTPVVANASSTAFVSGGSLVTGHSLGLTGLATGTSYYFLVQSSDASNNSATSTEFTMTTLGI